MSKLYALKNLLHAHIVLSVVSLFIFAGCATLQQNKAKPETFYPEYYAAKRLENPDIIKLRSYMASTDSKISAPAGLILGINALKYGDKNYGRMLIDKNYASPALDAQMAIFGKLWKMESLLSLGKKDEAEVLKNQVAALERDSLYLRTLKIYCVNAGITLKGTQDPIVCAEEVFKGPEAKKALSAEIAGAETLSQTPIGNMTYEEYSNYAQESGIEEIVLEKAFNENAEIDVIGGDIMSNMVQGMIYAIGDLKTSFTVNSVAMEKDVKNRNAVAVFIDKQEIHIEDDIISLAVDWQQLTNETFAVKDIQQEKNTVICASNNTVKYAKDLAQMLKDISSNDKNIKVLNYDNPAFQAQLRAYLEKTVKEPKDKKSGEPEYSSVNIIGMGSQEDIIKFIPIAKFLQNSSQQKIIMVVSSFTDTLINSDYGQYLKNTSVFTPIELVNNSKFDYVNSGYEVYFGAPMNLENILGYDSVVYLATVLEPNRGNLFLSGKDGFIDGKIYRKAKLYNVGKNLKVSETFYEEVPLKILSDEAENLSDNME